MDILEIVRKIDNFEFALSILKALRARIEHNLIVKELFTAPRIGRSFENGFKGVLAVGQSGGGKTSTLKSIYHGLELHLLDDKNNQLGIWVPSGISTGPGLFELLHINILKQIASGSISRLKYGNTSSMPFTGVLLGTTNGIPFKKALNDHIVAMLERFTLCHIEARHNNDEEFFSAANIRQQPTQAEWYTLQDAMISTCDYNLTDNEIEFARKLFLKKAAENLEPNKALYRQANDVLDILTFLKRLCQVINLLDNNELLDVARELVNRTVHCNPAKFLIMTPVERHVYQFIDNNDNKASFAKIAKHCEDYGYMTTTRKLKTILHKMLETRILNKKNEIYTNRRVTVEYTKSRLHNVF
jgi:hypothetical protein